MKYYYCPECEDQGELPDDTQVCYCGICAGDTGRDVRLIIRNHKEDLPKQAVDIKDSKAEIEPYQYGSMQAKPYNF